MVDTISSKATSNTEPTSPPPPPAPSGNDDFQKEINKKKEVTPPPPGDSKPAPSGGGPEAGYDASASGDGAPPDVANTLDGTGGTPAPQAAPKSTMADLANTLMVSDSGSGDTGDGYSGASGDALTDPQMAEALKAFTGSGASGDGGDGANDDLAPTLGDNGAYDLNALSSQSSTPLDPVYGSPLNERIADAEELAGKGFFELPDLEATLLSTSLLEGYGLITNKDRYAGYETVLDHNETIRYSGEDELPGDIIRYHKENKDGAIIDKGIILKEFSPDLYNSAAEDREAKHEALQIMEKHGVTERAANSFSGNREDVIGDYRKRNFRIWDNSSTFYSTTMQGLFYDLTTMSSANIFKDYQNRLASSLAAFDIREDDGTISLVFNQSPRNQSPYIGEFITIDAMQSPELYKMMNAHLTHGNHFFDWSTGHLSDTQLKELHSKSKDLSMVSGPGGGIAHPSFEYYFLPYTSELDTVYDYIKDAPSKPI